MNLFIEKTSQLFNLKDKNASLWVKITQDKEKSNWLKSKNRKLNARLKKSMNAACIQSEKMEEEIRQLNKKLNKAYDLQDMLSTIQEQLTLARQDVFEAHNELNWKSYHNLIPTPINWRKQRVNPIERLSGTDPNKWDSWLYSIEEKLDADAPLYEAEKCCITYALSQTSNILFKGMQSWVNSKKVLQHYMNSLTKPNIS